MTLPRRLVLVGGVPRSGTTMLGAMLGRHESALTIPESHFLDIAHREAGRGNPVWPAIRDHWRLAIWELPRDPLEERLANADSVREVLVGVTELYAEQRGLPMPQVLVDHTPSNRHRVTWLAEAFPGAVHLVHVVRDPRGSFASVRERDWGPNEPIDGARWWAKNLEAGLRTEADPTIPSSRVRYEDLLSDPAGQIRRLGEEAGVEVSVDARGDTSAYDVPAYTRGQHELVGGPVEIARASAWERELRPRHVEIIESIVGDRMDELGYERRYGSSPRPPRPWEERWLTRRAELRKRWIDDRRFARRRVATGSGG